MLRDITLGQYYPADSVIHKLDPRVKLFSTMIYIISLFCFRGVAALAIATVFLITVIKLSKVPFKFMVKGLKAIMILMLITAVFNLFLTPGEALVSVWRFTITKEGVTSAVLMAIRLTYLIPELLSMVDDGKIAFNPAVELSYLDSYQQRAVLDAMALNDCTPSHAQSIRLKKLAQEGLLDDQIVYAVLAETKPNQQEQLKFKREELRKYFPSGYTEEQMRRDIIKGLELLKRQRERNRDAR